MKKTLLMILVFVMLLSLCACGDDDTKITAPSGPNTSANSGTEGTNGATQPPHR